jgi:hypothetical protein
LVNLNKIDHLRGPGVNGRILLNQVLKKLAQLAAGRVHRGLLQMQ